MKSLGWQLFFALLLSDVVAAAMLKLGVNYGTTLTIFALVFVILAIVLAFGSRSARKAKQREKQAQVKIEQLKEQVATGAQKKPDDGTAV